MKKSLLTFAMAAFLCGMQANAANTDYLTGNTTPKAKVGETFNLELQLVNPTDVVAGYQANISATGAGTVTIGDKSIEKTYGFTTAGTELTNGWYGANEISDGTTNILCYSTSCNAFETSSTAKTIATIPVTFSEAGTYTFTLKNVVLSDEAGNAISPSDNVTFQVVVELGVDKRDFNEDEEFDMFDILTLYNAYLNEEEGEEFDYNGDGEFDMFDILALYNEYLNEE